MKPTSAYPCAKVLGISVDAIDMESGLRHVALLLRKSCKGYVCAISVHGVIEALRDHQLLQIYADSVMTIPDGMPLVWMGRRQGHAGMQRVTGPDMMLEIFQRREFSGVTHFFYGGDVGVAEELRARLERQFPWVKIVGTYTPPFRELLPSEEHRMIATIGELKPDIVWVGISCPKQEIFMNRYLPLLKTRLMFGVGAAFDFHTGRIRDCAPWIKHAGLQWVHRLMQDPRRLWRRYLRTHPAFVWHIALQISGMRRYPCPGEYSTRVEGAQPYGSEQ